MRLRVLLVTSWGTACGIAEYAALLKEAVEAADPEIEVIPSAEALDPDHYAVRSLFHDLQLSGIDILHLNHHDALHSRWTADHVKDFVDQGLPTLVTYHDSRAQLSDCPKLAALAQVASSVIVHEPVDGLKAIYWRQGVPGPAIRPRVYIPWSTGVLGSEISAFKAFPQQPVLGTVGFHFPWKNYDRLAQVTGEAGWALVLLANNATAEDEARWRAMNSSILVRREFLPGPEVVNYLAGCDATAWMYECANTGTSGAIRQGLAARKPVIALEGCRQFRDLYDTDAGILWCQDWDDFPLALARVQPQGWHPLVSAFAHRESWVQRGKDHAELYHILAGGSHA